MTASCVPPFVCCTAVAFIYSVFILYDLLPKAQATDLPSVNFARTSSYPLVLWIGVVFHVVFTMFGICFMRAMLTPIDTIPRSKVWASQYPLPRRHNDWLVNKIRHPGCEITEGDKQLIRSIPVIERKHGVGLSRMCNRCNLYKPDRCHHCRICNTCVLRMDHHCPWIANCVGFHNYKFFLLLLFYGTLCLGTVLVCMFERFVQVFRRPLDTLTFFRNQFPVAVAYVLTAFLFALLIAFFFFHLYLVSNSMTTIELKEKKNHRDIYVKHRFKIAHYKYEKGLYLNLVHVFGPFWMWLLPIGPTDPSLDDGTYSMNLPAPPVPPPP